MRVILIRLGYIKNETLTQIDPKQRRRRFLINFKGIVICHLEHRETYSDQPKIQSRKLA